MILTFFLVERPVKCIKLDECNKMDVYTECMVVFHLFSSCFSSVKDITSTRKHTLRSTKKTKIEETCPELPIKGTIVKKATYGNGLFATRDFSRGSKVAWYVGEIISEMDANSRIDQSYMRKVLIHNIAPFFHDKNINFFF